ncbi:MAG: hypothetical protein ACREFY_00085, partial [Acetobacteraceae bacterium]
TAAGDTALIGPGADLALGGTLSGVTMQLSAWEASGATGATPQLALRGTTLDGTTIEATGSGPFGAADNADLLVAGHVTNNGTIALAPAGGFGGDLEFALGRGAALVNNGTIAGSAFGTIDITSPSPARFINNGVVSLPGTSMKIAEPVSGIGQIELLRGANIGSHWGSQATLEATGAIGAGQTVTMQEGVLRLDQPRAFHGTIDATQVLPTLSGAPENTIQLAGVTATSERVSHDTLYLYASHRPVARLALDPSIAGEDFVLNVGTFYNGGGSGTSISILPPAGAAVASITPDKLAIAASTPEFIQRPAGGSAGSDGTGMGAPAMSLATGPLAGASSPADFTPKVAAVPAYGDSSPARPAFSAAADLHSTAPAPGSLLMPLLGS